MKVKFSAVFCCCMLAALFAASVVKSQDQDQPEAPREFRAVWVATVSNIDWPSRRTLSTEEAQQELLAIFDRSAELNLNAIIFQIRPMFDALYSSELEPWSEYLTGEMGQAPDPFWDPVEFAVTEARKRGMELHVWFNPYRARHPSARSELAENHISQTHPEIVREYGNYLWLDPTEEETKRKTLDVILDVVRRYDIDGVHIDDYFYPYRSYGGGAEFPDHAQWEAYQAAGGEMNRSDWRRSHVNDFVERFYREVKEEDPLVKVGISPFGIWRPGYPEGIEGLDQHEHLFADARLWLNEGWCDYYTPQLYWHMEREAQSYVRLLAWWVEQNFEGRHVWPGNFTNQIGSSADWPAEEILNQIEATRAQDGATGNVHFSMRTLMRNSKGIVGLLRDGPYAEPALVPASPWLKADQPPQPEFAVEGNRLAVSSEKAEQIRLWVMYLKNNDGWTMRVVPNDGSNHGSLEVEPGEFVEVQVSAVDRAGNESPRVSKALR
jgi:uncharacterized lipoprotein YddW (UPF0748 family)